MLLFKCFCPTLACTTPAGLTEEMIILVPMSINATIGDDKNVKNLEIVTQSNPTSKERGDTTMETTTEDSSEWIVHKTQSRHETGRTSGVYCPSTGNTIKWTDIVTVADTEQTDKYCTSQVELLPMGWNPNGQNYNNILGIAENKEKILTEYHNCFCKFVCVGAGVG